jgi:hypothetical protein
MRIQRGVATGEQVMQLINLGADVSAGVYVLAHSYSLLLRRRHVSMEWAHWHMR